MIATITLNFEVLNLYLILMQTSTNARENRRHHHPGSIASCSWSKDCYPAHQVRKRSEKVMVWYRCQGKTVGIPVSDWRMCIAVESLLEGLKTLPVAAVSDAAVFACVSVSIFAVLHFPGCSGFRSARRQTRPDQIVADSWPYKFTYLPSPFRCSP